MQDKCHYAQTSGYQNIRWHLQRKEGLVTSSTIMSPAWKSYNFTLDVLKNFIENR